MGDAHFAREKILSKKLIARKILGPEFVSTNSDVQSFFYMPFETAKQRTTTATFVTSHTLDNRNDALLPTIIQEEQPFCCLSFAIEHHEESSIVHHPPR